MRMGQLQGNSSPEVIIDMQEDICREGRYRTINKPVKQQAVSMRLNFHLVAESQEGEDEAGAHNLTKDTKDVQMHTASFFIMTS